MNLKQIKNFNEALEIFLEIDQFMTVARVHTLLSVYLNDLKTLGEVKAFYENVNVDRASISNATAARNISFWTEEAWLQSNGKRPQNYAALEYSPDPEDRRNKRLNVTPMGQELITKIATRME